MLLGGSEDDDNVDERPGFVEIDVQNRQFRNTISGRVSTN